MPKPRENEVVIVRDLLFAGLRFPLHPAVMSANFWRRLGQASRSLTKKSTLVALVPRI
jgi:hypothetical protein